MTTEQEESPTGVSWLRARLSSWRRSGALSPAPGEGESNRNLPIRVWEMVGYGSLLMTAGTMRLWDLGSRAIHHDESLHAFYSWNLSQGTGYQHNPMMHGPFQFEATAAIFFVLGDSDYTARLLYALVGTAVVAMPFLLRARLGLLGALLVSTMLTFSPAMLYFSRFARNDILMTAWTLGLVISIWRYLDEGKNRYLYVASAFLALAFATKETTYILTIILGLFFVILATSEGWSVRRRRSIVGVASPPVAATRATMEMWSAFRSGAKLSDASRPTALLVLLVTLTLPQWSAFISILQDTPLISWSNLVLANQEGALAVGAPSGGGLVIAGLVVVVLLGLSVYWGSKWNWPVWWRCAAIFYAVWILLYTTFFTNMVGIGSGSWQSLGYWIVQQGEHRGGQPWYYYFVITPIYEFLPLLFSVVAAVYYLRRRDVFALFLVYWSVATFFLYSIAGEKMPWLMVNITLPLIVLSGRFLAEVIRGIDWRRVVRGVGMLVIPGVPVLLVLLWRLALFESTGTGARNLLVPLGLGAGVLIIVGLGVYVASRIGVRSLAAVATVPIALTLLVLTVRTGSLAAYQNGDTPVEMIVYTQTSPDVTRLTEQIKRAADLTGQQFDIPISIDQTSGFSWPWAWYLRRYTSVGYPSYGDTPLSEVPDSSLVLVHDYNQEKADPILKDLFSEGERIKHRWWFPEESTYKHLTLGKFLQGFTDRGAWRSAMSYFLYREGVRDRLGSEDSYAYYSLEFPRGIQGAE